MKKILSVAYIKDIKIRLISNFFICYDIILIGGSMYKQLKNNDLVITNNKMGILNYLNENKMFFFGLENHIVWTNESRKIEICFSDWKKLCIFANLKETINNKKKYILQNENQ